MTVEGARTGLGAVEIHPLEAQLVQVLALALPLLTSALPQLELAVSRRDPYRGMSRVFHLLARK